MTKTVDFKNDPTLREKRGEGKQPADSPFLKEADSWMKSVLCPVCGSPMTLLKGRRGRFGSNITYQCHTEAKRGSYCLTVTTVTVGFSRLMRPGDFDPSDIGWEEVAEKSVEIKEGDKIVGVPRRGEDFVPEHFPPSPWVQNTRRNAIWRSFWELALENKGEVFIPDLVAGVKYIRGKEKYDSEKEKIQEIIHDIPGWITKMTNYEILLKEDRLKILGHGGGSKKQYPYSDPEYREEHGMD